MRQTRLVLWEGGGAEVELEGSSFTSTSPDGLSVEHQRELLAELRRALREGGLRGPDGRELVRRFREMRAEAQRSSFGITIPNLGLPRGHAVGLDVTSTEATDEGPSTVGGITLLIVGVGRQSNFSRGASPELQWAGAAA